MDLNPVPSSKHNQSSIEIVCFSSMLSETGKLIGTKVRVGKKTSKKSVYVLGEYIKLAISICLYNQVNLNILL